MKRIFMILASLLIAVLVWAAFVGIEPKDRRPGTRLSGTPNSGTPSAEAIDTTQEVHVQTNPWYGIPMSVTVVIGRDGQQLFSPSIYDKPGPFPGTKHWNRIIADNSAVTLRVGEQLYAMTLRPAKDDAERSAGLQALARKYPFWQQFANGDATPPPFEILVYEQQSTP